MSEEELEGCARAKSDSMFALVIFIKLYWNTAMNVYQNIVILSMVAWQKR